MTTDPTTEPLRFAYWVPNVSGGLVTSTIEQRTDWSFDYNRTLARLAERAGFDYALSQVRYTASYGAEFQHESTSFSLALLMATERLKLIAAVHPGLWHPGVLAKWVATADHLSGGRVAVNVVSGWFKDEFRQLGEPWLEHDERYRRTAEFILALKRIWTQDQANLAGDFYRIRDFSLKPKPLSWPGRPHPEIFQGGNSSAARRNGGQLSDWYFSNGKDFDGVRGAARRPARRSPTPRDAPTGRGSGSTGSSSSATPRPRPGSSCARSSPRRTSRRSRASGPRSSRPGRPPRDKKGMWADSSFEDLVQYNDGFRTQLIGTPEQVATRIISYRKLGVDLILTGFLHYHEEIERFGRDVLPIVRALEVEAGLDPAAVPDPGRGPDGARPGSRGRAMSVTSPAAPAEVLFSATEALAVARSYAESIASGVIERDRAGAVPYAELAALDASGLLGITVPAAHFGPDLSPVVLAEVIRTIAAIDPAIAQIPQAHFLFVDVLAAHGSAAQQERLFADVLAGARLGNGLAERGGQHAQDLKTRLLAGRRPAGRPAPDRAQVLLHRRDLGPLDRGQRAGRRRPPGPGLRRAGRPGRPRSARTGT